ncbi:MAG: cytochrome P460 family protein [Gammaproteobacteria bacterium]|nr:cytochrome P460 family protein [Gammaproteobacteria bacterium]
MEINAGRMMVAGVLATALATSVAAAEKGGGEIGAASFDAQGRLLQPQGYREWVFLGAPLTPHGLNDGKAGFPEFHHVYINPDAHDIYQRSGRFPEGTVIAKELLLVQKGDYPDGSKNAPSGRGYFADRYNGMDVMVKDSRRFKQSNGWGFFNFGHDAPPYAEAASAAPASSCASCHAANAQKDMVFTQFYPILR